MPIERLVHPDTIRKFSREIREIQRNPDTRIQTFLDPVREEIEYTQRVLFLKMRFTLTNFANENPDFQSDDYLFGFLLAYHAISTSLKAQKKTVPIISPATYDQYSQTIAQIGDVGGGSAAMNYLTNQSKTLMPELITLFDSIYYPLSFEVFWGIGEVASMFEIELGLDKQDQN